MSIYRRKYKTRDKAGHVTVKRAKTFTAEFSWNGVLYREAGFLNRDAARFWIEANRTKLQRGELGLVRKSENAAAMPLVEAFTTHLDSMKRDDKYVYNTKQRLERLARECPWMNVGDISIESFDRWRRSRPRFKGKVIGGRTLNQYLDHAREFCEWLIDQGKLATNPLARAARITAPMNDRYRRAATVEELSRLLATCDEGRRLQYLFRLYVPLRTESIARLTWGDLHLDATPPWGECDAWNNKSRKRIRFAIRYDLAQQLRLARGKSLKGDDVFPTMITIDELRDDLQRAGVPFDDGQGNRRLDFHAFRRTFIRLAKNAGVPMETAHLALHHADIRTTRKHYDDDTVEPPLTDAVERLPTIAPIRIARGDGTHG